METMPIRILHVIGHMDRGGAETMIMNYYRRIDRSRVQFDFAENSPHHAAYDDEILRLGGRIFRCPHYNGINHFTYVKWWERFFKEHANEYAAVHGHLGSTAAIYLSIAKKYGVYSVAHSHNTNGRGLKDGVYRLYSRPVRRIADFFFACSREAGIDRYGTRIADNPIVFRVLNNAIETKTFRFDPEARERIRKQYGWENCVVFGHVGRFSPQKNHSFLIDVFHEISKRRQDARLLLVGGGELEEQIVQKVKKLGLEDQVLFAGIQEQVAPFYQAMDVFLFPSLFEGLPLVTVETQTSGLPGLISEKVPRECILADDLMRVCPLEQGAARWAECALEMASRPRYDHSDRIVEKGYDISATARKLEEFYIHTGRKA